MTMPQVSVPRVSLPRPSASGFSGWVRRLPPVAAVAAAVGAVQRRFERLVSFRPRRSEVWLMATWVVLIAVSTVALFAYAGGPSDFGGELVRGLAVVVLFCVLSALTAALTTVLMGPRRTTRAEMDELIRALNEGAPAQATPQFSPRLERPEVVQPMLTQQGARRAS
jgi:hypothetical protein